MLRDLHRVAAWARKTARPNLARHVAISITLLLLAAVLGASAA